MRKTTFSVIVVIIVALMFLPNSFAQKTVQIPDANLAAAIRAELGLSQRHHITQQDMHNLTKLYAYNKHITDLTGLGYAKNLKYVYLGSNEVTDISPLAQLTNLETLFLSFNRIRDFTPLVGLTKLT